MLRIALLWPEVKRENFSRFGIQLKGAVSTNCQPSIGATDLICSVRSRARLRWYSDNATTSPITKTKRRIGNKTAAISMIRVPLIDFRLSQTRDIRPTLSVSDY